MVSAAYYLAVVRAMFMRESAELQLAPAGGAPPRDPALNAGVVLCLVVAVGSLFAAQPRIDVARSAADALPL
jgi:NADH:ubiquinone oxidoreductase subunit 2 (subunit N)